MNDEIAVSMGNHKSDMFAQYGPEGYTVHGKKVKPWVTLKVLKIRDGNLLIRGEHILDTVSDTDCYFIDDKGKRYDLIHTAKKENETETEGNEKEGKDTVRIKETFFELDVKLKGLKSLTFVAEDTGITPAISCGKYAKLHNTIAESYYERDGFVVTIKKDTIRVSKARLRNLIKRELKLDYKIAKRSGRKSLALYRFLSLIIKKTKKRPVWIVTDRDNAAGDNGEAFFKYLVKNEREAKVYFAIDAKCKDYSRIQKIGRVLKLNSLKYKVLFLAADKIISSQTGEWVTNAFGNDRKYMKSMYDYDYYFLQHGVILNDLSSWFMDYKRDPALFVTSARREYESILNYGFACNAETVKLTGLPRYDYLTSEPEKKIVFLPTWRRNIAGETVPGTSHRYYSETFKDSEYCRYYNALINDKRLVDHLREKGYTGEFYLHPAFSVQAVDFSGNDVVKVINDIADYNKLMKENSLLITDYSSVVFDFAYLKKPVVYTQFDEEEFLTQHHCSEGYFDYETDGFGPVARDLESTIDEIIKTVDDSCVMPDIYKERVDSFFEFTDKNNCERVYKAVKGGKAYKGQDARVRSHAFKIGDDAVTLFMAVTVKSDKQFKLRDEVVIDTDFGSGKERPEDETGRDNRYSISIVSDHRSRSDGCFTADAELSIEIPFERALMMERYNRVYLILDTENERKMVRLNNAKPREDGLARVTSIPGSSAAIYFNDTLKQFKIEVRERLYTDCPREQRKLELAYQLSRLTPNHKPVVMYEKDCSRYEESASVVYEALIDRGHRDVCYILDKNYDAASSIAPQYRKNIVRRFSLKHYYELFCARSIVSTETVGHSMERGCVSIPFNKYVMKGKKDYVFLQHGVMYMVPLSAESRGFFRKSGVKGKQRVVVSSQLEAEHFMNNTSYDSPEKIYLSGLPKFDRSVRFDNADKIVIMPTWRPWDYNMMMKNPKTTGYYNFVKSLYESVPDELKERVVLAPHPLVTKLMKDNNADTGIWANYDPHIKYDDLLKECDVLITDYSSIAYDAFYRGSNVIFCWEELEECMQHYGKDAKLMLTEDLAFGPVCRKAEEVGKALEAVYGKQQKQEYIDNYCRIVEFRDGKNTERVVEMLSEDRII